MIKLLSANFYELFKSKAFYITMLICFVLGGGLSPLMRESGNFNMPESSGVVMTKDNIFEFMPSFAALFISFAGASTVAILLDTQYNQGTLRNKLISGHSRTEIFFSHLIVSVVPTIVYFALFEVSTIGVAVFGYDYSYDVKATLLSLGVMLVMLITTGAVLSFIIGTFLGGGKLTVTLLAIQYALNMSVIIAIFKGDSKVLDMITRIFPQSSMLGFTYSVMPEKIWQNAVISLAMLVVMVIVGMVHFRKCDIK